MTTFSKSSLSICTVAALALLHGEPAHAAPPTKVWVANAGSDGNPCSISQPCLTFQHAHDTVAAGGEVDVLNPGDYGPVTINKSASIINDGVGEAGILATSGTAVTVGAGAGDIVGLRGLVLDGAITGNVGVLINSVGALHVESCVIRNFQGSTSARGLFVQPVAGVAMKLFMSDTIVFNNGGSANAEGIALVILTSPFDAVLERVQLENNTRGLRVLAISGAAAGQLHVTVRDSTVVGNVGDGILVDTIAPQPSQGSFVLVERTTIANNGGIGAHADSAHAIILLNKSKITNNGTGVSATNGGQVISYGNNKNNLNVGAEGAATGFFSPL